MASKSTRSTCRTKTMPKKTKVTYKRTPVKTKPKTKVTVKKTVVKRKK